MKTKEMLEKMNSMAKELGEYMKDEELREYRSLFNSLGAMFDNALIIKRRLSEKLETESENE